MYLAPWYDKHRPASLDEYVWTDQGTREKIEAWVAAPLGHPSLILAGPTGTGKTTLARLIKDAVGVDEGDYLFIPASARSGVETIRAEIIGFCEVGGFSRMKLILLDEAERLSRDAQESLRNVMDDYIRDVRFIFTANEPDRIIQPLKAGRSWLIEVKALDPDRFEERIADICEAEGIELNEEIVRKIETIIERFYPNMRGAISALQEYTLGGQGDEQISDGPEWASDLRALFQNFKMAKARDLVVSLRPDEYEAVYEYLYENAAELFGDNEGSAVITIAEYMYRGSMAGLPDITLCAALVELSETH